MRKKIVSSILLLLLCGMLIGCAAATTGNIMVMEVENVATLAYVADAKQSEAPGAETPQAEDVSDGVIEITPAPTPVQTVAVHTPAPTPEPEASPTAEPTPEFTVTDMDSTRGYVYAGTVNLRSGPDTEYELIAEYERGDKLYITGESGDWYRVEINDTVGYMLKEYVKTGTMPTPTQKPKETAKPTKEPEATATPAPSSVNASAAGSFSAADVYLAAQLVAKESGKDMDGYRAVASVIYNRVMSSKFPNTVEGVVFQDGQFSPAKDEAKLRAYTPSSDVVTAVQEVFGGNPMLPSNVLFFRSARSGTSWGSRTYYGTYGGNAFFS